MSMLNSIELIIEGKVLELIDMLDDIEKSNYVGLDLTSDIKELKENISNITICDMTRIFLSFIDKNNQLLNFIVNYSFDYPNLVFLVRKENDISFTEKKYKGGLLQESLEIDSLIKWRLHTESICLCSEDIREFIENDLEYLIDEIDTFDEFELAVLKEFEDVEFKTQYTKNDLRQDILNSYEYLTE